MDYILIVLVAFIISTISIIAGLGGGVLLIPILTVFFGLPLKTTIGTVLISLFFPALIGAIGAWRNGNVDFKLGLLFEVPTATGAVFGAKTVHSIPELYIKLLFGTIAILLSFQMIRNAKNTKNGNINKSKFWNKIGGIKPTIHISKTNKEGIQSEYDISIPSLIIGGFIIGFLAGTMGVGGGWIKTPLMILGFGIPPFIATGTSLFMITITAASGGITHLIYGSVDLSLLLALLIGLSSGAILGNSLKPRFKSYQITMVIGIVLVAVSIVMIASAV